MHLCGTIHDLIICHNTPISVIWQPLVVVRLLAAPLTCRCVRNTACGEATVSIGTRYRPLRSAERARGTSHGVSLVYGFKP